LPEVDTLLSLIHLGKPEGPVGTAGFITLALGLIFVYANIVRTRKELDRIEEKKSALKELSGLAKENASAEKSQKEAEAQLEKMES